MRGAEEKLRSRKRQLTATRRASPGRRVLLVRLFRLRISPGDVLKRREMLHNVSPDRTVYMMSFLGAAGTLSFCPTFSLCGSSSWVFASRMAVSVTPYSLAMEASVSPERTSCERPPLFPEPEDLADVEDDFFDAAATVADREDFFDGAAV